MESDSRRLRSFSLSNEAALGPLVVDDWRRIHGRLPNAMSTSDSRRPPEALERGLLFELAPPVRIEKETRSVKELFSRSNNEAPSNN